VPLIIREECILERDGLPFAAENILARGTISIPTFPGGKLPYAFPRIAVHYLPQVAAPLASELGAVSTLSILIVPPGERLFLEFRYDLRLQPELGLGLELRLRYSIGGPGLAGQDRPEVVRK
jgi:hypothetical protein